MNSLEEKYRQLTKKIESKSITSSTFLKELNNLCIDAMNHGQIAWHLYFKSSIAFHQIPDQKIHKGSFTRPPRTQDNFYDRPFQTDSVSLPGSLCDILESGKGRPERRFQRREGDR